MSQKPQKTIKMLAINGQVIFPSPKPLRRGKVPSAADRFDEMEQRRVEKSLEEEDYSREWFPGMV